MSITIINSDSQQEPKISKLGQQQSPSAASNNNNNSKPNQQPAQQTTLPIIHSLSQIYPDIEDQLCSRHSTLFGKLKYTFNKLYDSFQPEHYVVVNGLVNIVGGIGNPDSGETRNSTEGKEGKMDERDDNQNQIQLSMALENGIIVLVAKTYQNANIFINGNHIDQQLIFCPQGKLLQGLYQYSNEFQQILSNIIKQYSPKSHHGCIMYIHANLPQPISCYRNTLLTALSISTLTYLPVQVPPLAVLLPKMSVLCSIPLSYLQPIFYDYQPRVMSLKVANTMYKIRLEKNVKLLVCRLDLAESDIRHSQSQIRGQRQGRQKVKCIVKQMIQGQSDQTTQTPLHTEYKNLIQAEYLQLQSLSSFSNNSLSFPTLLSQKHNINCTLRQLYTPQVIDLLSSIECKTKISSYCLLENEFLLLAIENSQYMSTIRVLRQLLNRGQLKSKSCFHLEEQLVENRWSGDDGVGERIFGAGPSGGIGVIKPKGQIWFE